MLAVLELENAVVAGVEPEVCASVVTSVAGKKILRLGLTACCGNKKTNF